jgi:HNH endonuclease
VPGKSVPVIERLFDKILIGDGCWDWIASTSKGYGQLNVGGVPKKAHIVVWELLNGPVPDGMELDHLCRRPICTRPGHMEPVTHQENCRRGHRWKDWAPNISCPHGHALEGANLYVNPLGRRICRACRRVSQAAYKRRKLAS